MGPKPGLQWIMQQYEERKKLQLWTTCWPVYGAKERGIGSFRECRVETDVAWFSGFLKEV